MITPPLAAILPKDASSSILAISWRSTHFFDAIDQVQQPHDRSSIVVRTSWHWLFEVTSKLKVLHCWSNVCYIIERLRRKIQLDGRRARDASCQPYIASKWFRWRSLVNTWLELSGKYVWRQAGFVAPRKDRRQLGSKERIQNCNPWTQIPFDLGTFREPLSILNLNASSAGTLPFCILCAFWMLLVHSISIHTILQYSHPFKFRENSIWYAS